MKKEDIRRLIGQEEGTEFEYKSAKGGFPESFWETFSAFANTHGGIIVFGIKEKDDRLIPDGLDDSQIAKYKKTFGDCAHNKGKVSATMLAYFYAGSHSICGNPTLQKLFMFLGNGEKAGSGADIIRKGWDDNHWPAPELSERTQPDETMMMLRLADESVNQVANGVNGVTNGVTNQVNEATNEVANQVQIKEVQLTQEQLGIIEFCATPKSAQEILNRIGVSNQTRTRKKYILSLVDLGVLEMTNPETPNDPNQKYHKKRQ